MFYKDQEKYYKMAETAVQIIQQFHPEVIPETVKEVCIFTYLKHDYLLMKCQT